MDLSQYPPCPYCSEPLPRNPKGKVKCPHCGGFVHVKRSPDSPEPRPMTRAEAADVDKQWADRRERDFVDTLAAHGISADQWAARQRSTLRFGRHVPVDAVHDAWTSGDVNRMLKVLDHDTNPVDRHYLLLSLVQALYRDRDDPRVRAKLLKIGALHVAEMGELLPALCRHDAMNADARDALMAKYSSPSDPERAASEASTTSQGYSVPTFLLLVRTYCEDERYEEARTVWRHAHEIGYLDDAALAAELEGVEKRKRRNDKKKTGAGQS